MLKAEGQIALAIRHYRRALELDPTVGEAWNNLGNALAELGDLDDAVEAYLSAAEILPESDTLHYNVGILLMRLDRRQDALVHLRRAVELVPERDDAAHLLAALEGRTTATAPRAFVRDLFDSYAERFDAHLVGELRYAAHRETVSLLDEVAGDRRFALAYDLGCGTGLAGALIRSRSGLLVGIDLSERMLQQAGRKNLYDSLVCADIDAALDEYDAAPDLVVASDVFIHVGDLDPTVGRLARRMSPGGMFAFSIERATDGLRWFLRASGRYAHGDRYIAETLARHGFRLLARRTAVLRHDRSELIDGAVYLAVVPGDGGLPV